MNNFVTIIKLNILQLNNVTKMDIFEYKYVTCYENGVTPNIEAIINIILFTFFHSLLNIF